jgi:ATP-binding cassette subfamily B protein
MKFSLRKLRHPGTSARPSPHAHDDGRSDLPMLVYRRRDDDDDDTHYKPLEWSLLRRLFSYTRKYAAKRNALIFLTLLRSAQLPALVWLASRIIAGPIADLAGRGAPSLSELGPFFWGVAAYLVLAILTDGIFHFRQRFALELGESIVNDMRAEFFAHTQRMPMSFFHRMKLGRLISRMTSDIETVRTAIQDVFFVSIVQFGQIVFSAAVMAIVEWRLFLVVLGMAPVLWAINNHFRRRLSRDSRNAQESFSRVTATLAESINGIRVTQGFVRGQTNTGLFRNLLADHSRYNIAIARSSAVLIPLLELNSQFFVAILLVLGGWQVLHGVISIGVLIQFFLFSNQFFAPLQVLGNQYNQALVAMASAERLFRVLDTQPDWTDPSDATDLPDPRAGNTNDAPIGARIEFRNLTFGYNPAQPVLHDINFTASPGQMIALVGHTGSGKTSIIGLVAKFHLPASGEILIDGREIRTLASPSLHHQLGMVQQHNFLFSGTVLENIRYGKPAATGAEIREAAAKLDCLDLLEAMPAGLSTEVGERGSGLSTGQRQLVCFVRAMIADPRIIILDEATSSIDAVTEARLQRALVALLRGRTSFVVAHRLSTIRHADQVLVLDNGRIIERGTHDTLLRIPAGHYATLYRQFVQMDDDAFGESSENLKT